MRVNAGVRRNLFKEDEEKEGKEKDKGFAAKAVPEAWQGEGVYQHALQMLRCCPAGNLITTARDRTHNPA